MPSRHKPPVYRIPGMLHGPIRGVATPFRFFSERAIAVQQPREACLDRGFTPEFSGLAAAKALPMAAIAQSDPAGWATVAVFIAACRRPIVALTRPRGMPIF